jgi:hypothetical protein
MAGGWRLTGLLIMFTGAHFSVSADGTSLNASGNTQRANQVKPSVAILGGTGHGQSTAPSEPQRLQKHYRDQRRPWPEGIDERMRQFGLRVRF